METSQDAIKCSANDTSAACSLVVIMIGVIIARSICEKNGKQISGKPHRHAKPQTNRPVPVSSFS
jgi:hypothetical protein